MKNYRLILIGVGLLGIIIFIISHDPKIDCKSLIEMKKMESYSGIVFKKYIDSENHNWKKVILLNNKDERTLLLNWESSNLFTYLEIGDTLDKNKNELQIRIRKSTVDTLYRMKYYCNN